MLVNLLETREIKCQLGSLAVLLELSTANEMKRNLVDLGIVTPLIQLLKHPARDIQVLTVEIMANVAMIRKARKQIRIREGIPYIVSSQNYVIYMTFENMRALSWVCDW